MTETADWNRVKDIFQQALERSAQERPSFLTRVCGGDAALEHEVQSLLAAHAAAGGFAERPAADRWRSDARIRSPSATVGGARHPFVRVAWLVAMVELPVLLYAGWIVVRGAEYFGWTDARVAGSVQVLTVDDTGPAAGLVRPGDRVISMSGDPHVRTTTTAPHRRALRPGATYTLTVERSGRPRVLTLHVDRRRLWAEVEWFVISLLWCAIGLFMGVAGADRPLARLGFLTGTAVGQVFLQVGVIHAAFMVQPVHMVLGYHFLYAFPGGVAGGVFWSASLVAMYAGCVLPVVVGLWLDGVFLLRGPEAATTWMATHTVLTAARQAMTLAVGTLASFAMVAVMLRNYRLVTEPDGRRRIRWVICSSVIGLLPQIWWAIGNDYNVVVGPAQPVPLYSVLINGMTLAVPLSVAYAVVRHRVLDVTVVVRRGLQYVLARRGLEGLLAVPTIALVVAVITNRNQTIADLFWHHTGTVFWIAALGLSAQFKAPLHAWLERRFFRQQYDRDALLLGLVNDLDHVDSLDELARLVGTRLEYALQPKALYLWYRDGSALLLGYSSSPDPAPPVLVSDDAYLVVPITDREGRLTGVLMLAERRSEEPYTANDRGLLETVAKQVGFVRESLRLQALVGEEQRIRHQVLARLDSGVHVLRECPTCGTCFDSGAERCDSDGAALTLSLPVERVIDGRYRLDRLIGRGGMGAVYEALDVELARPVAIKIVLGAYLGREASARRFQREARAAARLRHPHVVRVYDYGTTGTAAFLVMERVRGETLRTVLKRVGVLPGPTAAEWFEQILDGVDAAHEGGIVHRDLKPENIIGERSGGSTGRVTVKILDFGLAKVRSLETSTSASLTATGVVVGTLGYMSPEQLLGQEVDERTDIFATGVMVVEALSGRRPFGGEGYSQLLREMLRDDLPLLADLPGGKAVDAVARRATARNPRDRFASARAMRAELIPALRMLPPSTRPIHASRAARATAGPSNSD